MANVDLSTYGGQTGPDAPTEGHVVLDGAALLLVAESYTQQDLTPFAPKQSQGAPGYGDFSPFDTPQAQDTWEHGFGIKRARRGALQRDEQGYWETLNVDASTPGRAIISPPIVWERLYGAAAQAEAVVDVVRFAGTYVAATTGHLQYRADASGAWTDWDGYAAGITVTDLEVFGGALYVGRGDSTTVLRYTTLGGAATALAGVYAKYLASEKLGIYRAWAKNQVQGSADGTTWTEPILTVGSTDYDLTGLLPGGGLVGLWVPKEDALWAFPLSTSGQPTKYLPFERRHPNNGHHALWHGTRVLVPQGWGLWAFSPSSQDSGSAEDLSPSRGRETGRVRGEIAALAASPRWVYAAQVDPQSDTPTPSDNAQAVPAFQLD